MRTLAIVVMVWSLVGMPTLCRAGILVECCTLGPPGHEKSHDAPDECPNQCPDDNGEKCPDDTRSSEPRDCDSCTESCNVILLHSKQTSDHDVALMPVAATAATQALADEGLPRQIGSRDVSAEPLYEHLPFPVSDRPLLI